MTKELPFSRIIDTQEYTLPNSESYVGDRIIELKDVIIHFNILINPEHKDILLNMTSKGMVRGLEIPAAEVKLTYYHPKIFDENYVLRIFLKIVNEIIREIEEVRKYWKASNYDEEKTFLLRTDGGHFVVQPATDFPKYFYVPYLMRHVIKQFLKKYPTPKKSKDK